MTEATRIGSRWFDSTAVSVKKYFLFSSLALIVVFAWMEPAGASGLGFARGLVFWTVQISILIPLLIAIQHGVSHCVTLKSFALASSAKPWMQTALSGVVAALLFVPFAYLLDVIFGIPDDDASLGLLWSLCDEAAGVVVPVTVTWLALNAPWICQLDFSQRLPVVATEHLSLQPGGSLQAAAEMSRFLQELRGRASGDLISISSELHYVRVVTTDSEVMFLYNLKDAIEELPADAGVHIHRSHWVSRSHIKEVTKRQGISECTLSNGRRLPVSRRKYLEVRDLLSS